MKTLLWMRFQLENKSQSKKTLELKKKKKNSDDQRTEARFLAGMPATFLAWQTAHSVGWLGSWSLAPKVLPPLIPFSFWPLPPFNFMDFARDILSAFLLSLEEISAQTAEAWNSWLLLTAT